MSDNSKKDHAMKTIVLISCGKDKRPQRAKAGDIYRGSLFTKSLIYAQKLNPDKIFILSAKHRLLELDTEIEPYDMTLNNMNTHERRQWADRVLEKLRSCSDIDNDAFVFLAGSKYREFLICHIRHSSVPMKGLKQGEQLKWLNEQINEW